MLVVLVGGTAALDYACYAIAVAVPAPGDPYPAPEIRAADLAVRAIRNGGLPGMVVGFGRRYRYPGGRRCRGRRG